MSKATHRLDIRPHGHSDGVAESRTSIQSLTTVNSSAPVSPVVSLFSAKGHTRLSSSVSSLVSLSGLGHSTEISKPQLTEVREEDFVASDTKDLEDDYFQHFDQGMSVTDESYFAFGDYHDDYDLTDAGMDVSRSPKKRRSDNTSVKGISRIGSRISTMSNRWRSKRSSDGQTGDESSSEELRSRANSASSTMVNPTISSLTRLDSRMPPSPARTLFEERLSEASVYPIDIAKANSGNAEDCVPKSTTPLLPPFMRDSVASATPSTVHSPLQSPSVADVSNLDDDEDALAVDPRTAGMPSPPLSTKPSVASFCRQPAASLRIVSGDGSRGLLLMSSPNDPWAHKLGHANFSIQPEPYEPEVCDPDTFEQLRSDWETARCNFARHLVRTGEHYGITSNIYRFTEEKWESINREWRRVQDAMLTRLEASGAVVAPLTHSNMHAGEVLRLPRLHDTAKFPELGDGEIVGPMSVAPAIVGQAPCRTKTLRKRNFFRFFQDLVSRS